MFKGDNVHKTGKTFINIGFLKLSFICVKKSVHELLKHPVVPSSVAVLCLSTCTFRGGGLATSYFTMITHGRTMRSVEYAECRKCGV